MSIRSIAKLVSQLWTRAYRSGLTPALVGARPRKSRLRVFLQRQSRFKNDITLLRGQKTQGVMFYAAYADSGLASSKVMVTTILSPAR